MNKMSLGLTIACASLFATLGAEPIPSQNLQVVSLYDASQSSFDKIMEGKHPETVIEFPAKTALPIHFFLKGDLLNFVETTDNPGYIEVKQKFYARCVEKGEPVFSSNLKTWKSFAEFITGNISVDLNMKDGHPSIVVGSETNRKT
jgi:hypothetical protein